MIEVEAGHRCKSSFRPPPAGRGARPTAIFGETEGTAKSRTYRPGYRGSRQSTFPEGCPTWQRTLRLAAAVALLAALAVGTGSVAADPSDNFKILDTRLVGVPDPQAAVVGVNGAGAAWTHRRQPRKAVRRWQAPPSRRRPRLRVGRECRQNAQPPPGSIVVTCNGNANTGHGPGQYRSHPLLGPRRRPAHFNAKLDLPSPCFAPVAVLHERPRRQLVRRQRLSHSAAGRSRAVGQAVGTMAAIRRRVL